MEGTQLGAATNIDGYYMILNVPPSTYSIKFMSMGYTPKRIDGVRVSVGLTAKINMTLDQSVIEMGEVVVAASRPVIEVDRTNTAAYMSTDEISELPVTEVDQIIQLQAGVTQDANGELHFRGGRSGEVAYLVDGVPVTNRFDGGSSIEIENEVIQELQVISGTFNAEYGQAQSGIINVISKKRRVKNTLEESVCMPVVTSVTILILFWGLMIPQTIPSTIFRQTLAVRFHSLKRFLLWLSPL